MALINLKEVYPVTSHTDHVGQGTTFVAIPGKQHNGSDFIAQALQKGAGAIVVQKDSVISQDLYKQIIDAKAEFVQVDDCRKTLAEMSAKALGYPAKKLKIIGVTGTKGKTSTCYILYNMLLHLGKKVALSSTIEKRINQDFVKIPLTTPLPDQLHMFLAECVKHDIEYVIMEVSAQSLSLYRVFGIEFEAGVFTNFSMEHLEFYSDMQAYFNAKELLFSQVKHLDNMFINIDDPYGLKLAQKYTKASTFSLQEKKTSIYAWPHAQGNELILHIKIADVVYNFQTSLLGTFNVYNVVAALGVVHAFGIDIAPLKDAIGNMQAVPGRMEQYVLKNKARCFIDYAHNPSSFEAVLSTLRSMTNNLITVFGAGGNRDKQKRPLMGAIAQKYSNVVVLTADNPRDESPSAIIHDIQSGFKADTHCILYKELNRTKAIEFACDLAQEGSIVAVLGKGRDEYQIVGDLTFPFKERAIIKPFIQEKV